ncbi:MAG: Pyrolysin precursor [Candidatus Methanofastidiosum methylothiophilum]|uniref:Pyrolysin n=1 Tax=Candidatus Methanofastidiosum methylothiophilum TaxID=1705564 RepID=A0A150J8R2_9EURY|nr:MAG: Pyrolysin precursor [Candidatus Methanofastidiosum methylthiophilus]
MKKYLTMIFVAIILVSIAPTFGEDTNWDKMDNIVKEKVQNGEGSIDVILEFVEINETTRKIVTEMGGTIISEFPSINSLATILSSEQIKTISQNSLVIFIHSVNQGQYYGFMSNDTMNTTSVKNLGYSGNGVTVVIIDSGLRSTHQEFTNTNILYTWDFVNNNSVVSDDTVGHGTMVASCIFGNYYTTQSFSQDYPAYTIPATSSNKLGVSPKANLIFLQNLLGGSPNTLASLDAMEWCIANKNKYNIRVVNMSFGLGSIPNGNSPESKLADRMVDSGIVVVVSAGNYGPGSGTIGTPGDARNVITVGGIKDRTLSATVYSRLSPYQMYCVTPLGNCSSRGPTSDGRVKPDVVAPAESVIVATFSADTSYGIASGTSFASPYTTGTCALILQRHPNWTPYQVKEALMRTATPLGFGQYDQGAGLVNAQKAIAYRQSFERSSAIPKILEILKKNKETN